MKCPIIDINNYMVYVCMFICIKQKTSSLFFFMIQLCYSRQNKNKSKNKKMITIFKIAKVLFKNIFYFSSFGKIFTIKENNYKQNFGIIIITLVLISFLLSSDRVENMPKCKLEFFRFPSPFPLNFTAVTLAKLNSTNS